MPGGESPVHGDTCMGKINSGVDLLSLNWAFWL